MVALDRALARLAQALLALAGLMLLAMMLIICADVFTRNIHLPGLPRGVSWSNEISELLLYAITMAAAPWLLRQGRHIRVDILLRAIPARAAWACEWLADLLGLACSVLLAWYGWVATAKSLSSGAQSIKTLVMPEWWFMAPLPACALLLAVEFVFRMRRLAAGPVAPRDDAVSAA